MLEAAPREFTNGMFFDKFLQRYEVCGTRSDSDGTWLVLRCRGCGFDLNYEWLKKRPGETWTGEFGKRVKHRLTTNRAHNKCRAKIEERNEAFQMQKLQTSSNALTVASSAPAPVIQTNIQAIQNIHQTIQNIVIVNLPAVTRTGSTGDPLMCSDVPYPDNKTVKALLDDPESAIPQFVYKRFLASETPSITAPDPSNTKLKVVHRDNFGNHWVDAPLDATVDNLVYNTLDSLDDTFNAMKHTEFKDWKRREGLTAATGFDKTEAYQKMQDDVVSVLKQHGAPYM